LTTDEKSALAEPATLQSTPRRRRRRFRLTPRGRKIFRGLLLTFIAFLGLVSWSLGRALTAPGNDPIAARLAEWGRDHGLGVLVTAAEDIQYRLHPPKVGGKPNTSVLAGLGQTPSATTHLAIPGAVTVHAPLAPIASPGLPGEGVFRTVAVVNGQPAIQVAYLRPDALHTSYLAGVAWMSGKLLRLEQHPGFADPGQLNLWSLPDTIPVTARAGLEATFNSGFKIQDSGGGYYSNGHTVGTLAPGEASLVVYRDGHTDIGAWGSGGLRLSSDVVSVRQNLKLLINNGQLSPNLASDVQSNWGATINGAYFVWRSGIGVTASGDLVYVAGDALSVSSLANLLHRAGAVRAMQLDINVAWISYMWYTPGSGGSPTPHKLVNFQRPVNRYYTPTSRDFFAVYAR
jgi:hypothetical protein